MSGENWFKGEDKSKGIGKLTRYSVVTPFVDAEEYYADLRREVEGTKQGDLICWIAFDGGDAVPMPAKPNTPAKKPYPPRVPENDDITWFDLLKDANTRRVMIRALLNLHPSPSPANRHRLANYDLVRKLNQLSNCGAIDDFRFLWLNGTHHQKLVLVVRDSAPIAYCGTMDVHQARIENRWCEIHCKFIGEAAIELYKVFLVRWREHTEILGWLGSINSYLKQLDILKTNGSGGNLLVQIATTYGNPKRMNPFVGLGPSGRNLLRQQVNKPHRVEFRSDRAIPILGLLSSSPVVRVGNDFFIEKEPDATKLIEEAEKQSPSYAFAPQGHTGIYHMLKHAIEQVQKFIYVEDQYLVCDEPMGILESMADLLAKKLRDSKDFKKLIILMTRIDDINAEFQFTAWAHRRNLLQKLIAAGGDKVVVCQYKSRKELGIPDSTGGPPKGHEAAFYVHSKTWFFDDELLVCGSANCNRRGYSHDSELDFAIYDQDKRFVHDLRVKTWLNRLNTQNVPKLVTAGDVSDFASGARFWENPGKYGLAIENNRPSLSRLAPNWHHDLDVQALIDLFNANRNPFSVIFSDWLRKVKKKGLWDFIVDPDGT